jgi:hypothetical protein
MNSTTYAEPLLSARIKMEHPVKDVQWLAAVVAVISGLVAIALGVTKLHQWLKSRR